MLQPTPSTEQRSASLPDAYVQRIFEHMSCCYGSKFLDMWAGQDLAAVRAYWGRKLGRFSVAAIGAALSALESSPFPPTLPEFIDLCRAASAREASRAPLPALPAEVPKAVAETRAVDAQRMAASVVKVAGSKSWALRLRERYLAGGKLAMVQISAASEALGEAWAVGKIEITPALKAA